MPTNPLHQQEAGTLDENVIRPNAQRARFGWRWLVSCLYLIFLTSVIALILWPQGYSGHNLSGITSFLELPNGLFVLLPLLSSGLLFFRTQIGWVMGTIIVSAMIVVSALGLIAQFIPSIEPADAFRGARMLTSSISLLLACGTLYLLSHRTLRAGFRVPNSWIQRSITFGGLIGTGTGVWLLYLTGMFGRL